MVRLLALLLLAGSVHANDWPPPANECLPPEAWPTEVREIPLPSVRDVTALARKVAGKEFRHLGALRGFAWINPFTHEWWVVYVQGDEEARNHELWHTRCPFASHD